MESATKESIENVEVTSKKRNIDIKDYLSKNLLAVGSVLIIVVGILKLSYFYFQFNVNITDYIDVSEIISLYLLEAIYTGLYLSCIYTLIFILRFYYRSDNQNLVKFYYANIDSMTFLSMYAIMVIVITIYGYYYDFPMFTKSRYSSIPIILFLVVLFIDKTKLSRVIKDKGIWYNFFLSLCLLLTFVITRTDTKVAEIKYNKASKEYTFLYQDKAIKTSDSLKYIGQTSKYIFLYEKSDLTTYIYEKEKISNLTIKQLPKIRELGFERPFFK